jgi:hypothetical protein
LRTSRSSKLPSRQAYPKKSSNIASQERVTVAPKENNGRKTLDEVKENVWTEITKSINEI